MPTHSTLIPHNFHSCYWPYTVTLARAPHGWHYTVSKDRLAWYWRSSCNSGVLSAYRLWIIWCDFIKRSEVPLTKTANVTERCWTQPNKSVSESIFVPVTYQSLLPCCGTGRAHLCLLWPEEERKKNEETTEQLLRALMCDGGSEEVTLWLNMLWVWIDRHRITTLNSSMLNRAAIGHSLHKGLIVVTSPHAEYRNITTEYTGGVFIT